MKTQPKLVKIIILSAIAIGIAGLCSFLVYKFLPGMFIQNAPFSRLVIELFIIGLPGYIACKIFFSVSLGYTTISIKADGISIRQPLKMVNRHFSWEEIKGYSESVINFGRTVSKSIVIYTNGGLTYEIVKSYNINFKQIIPHLQKYDARYFGKEPRINRLFFRKYAYKD